MREQIITSLLDTDFYKFTMGQIASQHDVRVKYRFINRTQDIDLPQWLPLQQLKEQFEHIRTLKFTDVELEYLENQEIFSQQYVDSLRDFSLPPIILKTSSPHDRAGKEFIIEVEGPWHEAIFWETYILSTVNELFYKTTLPKGQYQRCSVLGKRKLAEKIEKIRSFPYEISFSDFGTRRRASKQWHREIVSSLSKTDLGISKFIGTSNVALAKEFDIKPIGTFAHELPMIFGGMHYDTDASLVSSHNKALHEWENQYGEQLSIALTDTYGTDFFFKDFSRSQAERWKGLRHDSGDPLAFARKAINFYESNKIDPSTKTIVFSDGLDLPKIFTLTKALDKRINTSFGWGTNLTNDIGARTLSIVVKAVEANGNPLVKLSDNLAKATGDPEAIQRYKKVFDHSVSYEETPTY